MTYRFLLCPWVVAIIVAASCLAMQGCSPDQLDSAHGIDICMKREVFDECMKSLPLGPQRAHYNDWSEVVEVCDNRSHWMAYRLKRHIPAGCR